MRELASREKVAAYLDQCLEGEHGPLFFLKALQYVTDHGYGKPTQAVELSGKVEGGVLMVPAPVNPAEWAEAAARQQAAMHSNEGEG
jgi:hypothetical protein